MPFRSKRRNGFKKKRFSSCSFRRTGGGFRRKKFAKNVRRVVRKMSEKKWIQSALGTVTFTNAAWSGVLCILPVTGAGKDDRIGDEIFARWWHLRFNLSPNTYQLTPQNGYQIRMVVFRMRLNDNTTDPIGSVPGADGTATFFGTWDYSRYRIIKDKYIQLRANHYSALELNSGSGVTSYLGNMYMKMFYKISFNAAGNVTSKNGQMGIAFITREALTAAGVINFTVQDVLSFNDS